MHELIESLGVCVLISFMIFVCCFHVEIPKGIHSSLLFLGVSRHIRSCTDNLILTLEGVSLLQHYSAYIVLGLSPISRIIMLYSTVLTPTLILCLYSSSIINSKHEQT